jgi:hypothetical protein
MKSFVLTTCLTCLTICSFAQTRSMGSDGILGKLETVIDAAEERDMEVVRIEADIIRTTKESIRTLDPSYSYTIIAVGSDRIADLDIEVYKMIDGEWTLLKKDTDDQNVAGVEVKPSNYAEYKVVVTAYKFNEGYEVGHYGLVYIHD